MAWRQRLQFPGHIFKPAQRILVLQATFELEQFPLSGIDSFKNLLVRSASGINLLLDHLNQSDHDTLDHEVDHSGKNQGKECLICSTSDKVRDLCQVKDSNVSND